MELAKGNTAERKMLMMRRRLKQHQRGEAINIARPLTKEMLGKYIPAGRFKNVGLDAQGVAYAVLGQGAE